MADYKTIARNTIYLYIRMIVNVSVSLYTSRLLLQMLGIVDFGLYNVVGGIIGMITFFQSTLTNVNLRFFSVAIGKGDIEKMKKIYKFCNALYFYLFIIVLLIGETLGIWFLLTQMTIPNDRMLAAVCIFEFSILSFGLSMFSITNNAAVIAHENMGVFAYVGLFQTFARLILVISISCFCGDKLILYGLSECVILLRVWLMYTIYARKHYPEYCLGMRWDKQVFKDFLPYISWNLVGCGTWAVNGQGINILINQFFGAAMNTARGIAFQLNNLCKMFSNNMFAAFRPQILKYYSMGDIDDYKRLFIRSSLFSVTLMWLISFPVISNIDYLLNIWLGYYPSETTLFSILAILFYLVDTLNEPIWTGVQASGNIKNYQLWGNFIFISAFPLSYIGLKNGFDASFPMIIMLIIRIVYIFVIVSLVRKEIQFGLLEYIRKILLPLFLLIGTSYTTIKYIYYFIDLDGITGVFIKTILITVINMILSYCIILDKSERKFINKLFKYSK